MRKKETASADTPRLSDTKPQALQNVKLTRMRGDGHFYPAVECKGALPKEGAMVTCVLENGVSYQGTVTAAAEIDGVNLIEFADGLNPLPVEEG